MRLLRRCDAIIRIISNRDAWIAFSICILLITTGCATTADKRGFTSSQAELQKEHDELLHEYGQLMADYEEIQKEHEGLKKLLDQTETELETSRLRIQALTAEIDDYAREFDQTQERLRDEIERLSKTLQTLEQQIQIEYEWRKYSAKATEAYDKDDYKTAFGEYEKAIASGCGDGIIWYRYAYSSERLNGLTEETIGIFRIAYELLKRQYHNHRYVKYAQKKVDLFFLPTDTSTRKEAVLQNILLDTTLKQAALLVFPRIGVEVTYNEEIQEANVKFLTPNTYEVDLTNIYGRWRDNQWAVLQAFKNSNIAVQNVAVETNFIDTEGFMKFVHIADHVDEYATMVDDEAWLDTATIYERANESEEWELRE